MTSPERHRTPRSPLPSWLGASFEPLYRAVIERRNRRYDSGRGVVEFDRPCISVGNLSVGGTGKTPMVATVVGWLRGAGHAPVIAMRGYRSRGGESDEAREHRARFPDVPIVARPDRAQALIELFDRTEEEGRRLDCIVLDDGFQHRRIARQLDIVLIDATRDPFADRLLPAGWLREPVSSLTRAHAVVVTHAEAVEAAVLKGLLDRLRGACSPATAWAICRHVWAGFVRRGPDGTETRLGADALRQEEVTALCAIGNPEAFLRMARRHCGRCDHALVLRDHARFPARLVRRLASGGGIVLTTEKDWSRLAPLWPDHASATVVRPVLTLAFDSGGDELRARVLAVARTSRSEDRFSSPTGHGLPAPEGEEGE